MAETKVTCSAHRGLAFRQCKATANLTRVLIETNPLQRGLLVLPALAVIYLCPKHFILKETK